MSRPPRLAGSSAFSGSSSSRSSLRGRRAATPVGLVRLAGVLVLVALVLGAAGCATAQIGSVGAVLGVDRETGNVFVREAREGLAADKVGLRPGDEILMIDGVYARDLGAAGVRDKLRGPPGSTVALTVVRGDEVLHVTVTREPLAAPGPPPPPKEERIAP